MMNKSKNVPKSLEPVISRWLAQNKEFYLGPENIFFHDTHRILYLANPDIPTAPGSWFCDSRRQPDNSIPKLTAREIQDIATELARYHSPTRWTLCLDYHCNYDCPMCPYHGSGYEEEEQFKDYWDKHAPQKRVVHKEEALAVIDELEKNKINILSIQSAGELFLYPFWEDVAKYAQDKGMKLWSITNGSLIDDKVAEKLAKYGFTDMRVSLDAYSYEVYAKIRTKRREWYDRSMAAPELLSRHGIKVNVHFVKQQENMHEIDLFLEHWKKSEVDSISIANQFVYNDSGCSNKLENHEDRAPYIHGICSKFGNFSTWNDGTIVPCCGATPIFTDKNNHSLPKVKLNGNNFKQSVETLNQLMSDPNSPFKKVCAQCSLYTVFSREKIVDGWKVNINPERETWTRVSAPNAFERAMRNAPLHEPVAG